MNLMNMAMRYVGPMVAVRIASKLGIGGPIVNKLIAAALPAVLGSVIGKSQTSGGLGSLMELVTGAQRPDPKGLETIFEAGGDIDDFAKQGGGLLEGLLGGQGMGAMTEALGAHAGIDSSKAGSLLGMIAPVALGSIGNQVAEEGLDASGLSSFLQGQSANVAQAMPAGLASDLEGTGLLDGITGSFGDAAASATSAAHSSVKAAETSAKSSMGMLPLIVGAVALALAGWFLFGKGGAPEIDTSAIDSGASIVVGDVNVGEELSGITGGLTEAFQGITDTATAEAALPRLEELSGQIGSLTDSVGSLGGEAKSGLQGIVSAAVAQLRPMIDSAIERSGAGGILQPVADQIIAALEGLAG